MLYRRPIQKTQPNSIKVLKEKATKENPEKTKKQNTHINTKYTLRSLNGGGTTDAVPSVNEWY